MTGLNMREWREKLRRLVTVEPVIFFYMTSTFIVTPAYQQLVITKVCNELFTDSEICKNPEHYTQDEEIQARSSYILLFYTAILSLVSIPPALLLGSWSDQAGRRSVMVMPSLLSLLSGAVFITLDLVEDMTVYWCLAAAALTGLSGGHVSVFLSCFSYLADVTAGSSSARTLRMAMAESMIFVGGTVGFLLAGFLEQEYGLLYAFVAYCACHVLAVLYILLWLQDPRPVKLNRSPSLKAESEKGAIEEPPRSRPFILQYAKLSLKAVFRRRPGQERLKLHFLILCTFINNLMAVGETSILLLYLMYEPREFTTVLFGVFNAVRMLLLGFSLLGLFPLLLRCFSEMTLAKLSALTRAAAYILLACSTNTWMVFLVAVVGAPAGITQAVIRSLSSAIVELDEQGAMFSFTASVEATCILIAGTMFNGLYPLTLTTFPGMPFIVMAGFAIIVLIFMQWISEMPASQPRLVL
ncbi:proton-coupled folate transporter [Chanos chanos]|uniref:Proton-coupled folate transporter n=1 Tax=Chanos chanos TaxID=29144 RepID=A0A6J2WHQ4_CHACN|nr:proton-coupled folate transporter-like [Chanos chanos]